MLSKAKTASAVLPVLRKRVNSFLCARSKMHRVQGCILCRLLSLLQEVSREEGEQMKMMGFEGRVELHMEEPFNGLEYATKEDGHPMRGYIEADRILLDGEDIQEDGKRVRWPVRTGELSGATFVANAKKRKHLTTCAICGKPLLVDAHIAWIDATEIAHYSCAYRSRLQAGRISESNKED